MFQHDGAPFSFGASANVPVQKCTCGQQWLFKEVVAFVPAATS